jgi:hypothetical protein
MTYAVELSTCNQLERLNNQFPGIFGGLEAANSRIEIVVIKVNPAKDRTLDSVVGLINKMNQRGNCAGLERVRLLQNKGEKWESLLR